MADNPHTSPPTLADMIGDEDVEVRENVAKNTDMPDVLVEPAEDENWNLRPRMDMARSPHTLPQILARLARDESREVRMAVVENPATPPEVLVGLAVDEDVDVREWVAWQATTPAEALAVLARDEDVYVRVLVVENSRTPPDVLARLAGDQSWRVRMAADKKKSSG